MDAQKYIEKKAKGLAEIVKAGGGYAIAYKKFDPDTGEALEPEIQAVSVDNLNEQKKALQDQIADIDAMLKDVTSLK